MKDDTMIRIKRESKLDEETAQKTDKFHGTIIAVLIFIVVFMAVIDYKG